MGDTRFDRRRQRNRYAGPEYDPDLYNSESSIEYSGTDSGSNTSTDVTGQSYNDTDSSLDNATNSSAYSELSASDNETGGRAIKHKSPTRERDERLKRRSHDQRKLDHERHKKLSRRKERRLRQEQERYHQVPEIFAASAAGARPAAQPDPAQAQAEKEALLRETERIRQDMERINRTRAAKAKTPAAAPTLQNSAAPKAQNQAKKQLNEQHYESNIVIHFSGTPKQIADAGGIENLKAEDLHMSVFELNASANVDGWVSQSMSTEEMNSRREFENGFIAKMVLTKATSSFPKPVAVKSLGIEHANELNQPTGEKVCFSISPGNTVSHETIYDAKSIKDSQTRRVFGGETYGKILSRDIMTVRNHPLYPKGALAVRIDTDPSKNFHSGPSPMLQTITNYCMAHGAKITESTDGKHMLFPAELADQCLSKARALALVHIRNTDLAEALNFKLVGYADGSEMSDFSGTKLQRTDQDTLAQLEARTPMFATAEIKFTWTVPIRSAESAMPAPPKQTNELIDRLEDERRAALSRYSTTKTK